MKIWILKASEPTFWDHQRHGTRKYRYTMLSEALIAAGHEVLFWTDDYDHFRKEYRFGHDHQEEVVPGLTVKWLHTPGYNRNVSLRRFRDHWILAKQIGKHAARLKAPDMMLAGMPSDAMCVQAIQMGLQTETPVVLDVRDLWPDAFYPRLPLALRPFLWLYCRPMVRRLKWAFRRATAVVGNTPGFVKWGLRWAGRQQTELDKSFPIGSVSESPNREDLLDGHAFWRSVGIGADDGVFRICFFGTLGPMYDFRNILDASCLMMRDSRRVQFVLCGSGPLEDSLRRAARSKDLDILFPGWIDRGKVWSLMELSHLGLACYTDEPNFRLNLTNKPGEYLSASLPVLTSIPGVLADMLEQYEAGCRYDDAADLAASIRRYRDDKEFQRQQKSKAKILFDDYFNADNVYPQFVRHLEKIASMHMSTHPVRTGDAKSNTASDSSCHR